MTFAKSIEFHELLIKVYKELSYNLIEVPFGTIDARVNFILEQIESLTPAE